MRLFKRWDDEGDADGTRETIRRLALWHLDQVGSEEPARSVRDRLRQLVAGACDRELVLFDLDHECLTAHSGLHLRQVLAFFQKRADLDIGVDREQVALAKFKETEVQCKETNDLFRMRATGLVNFQPVVERVLSRSARKIARILGRVPELSQLRPVFGPGASTQVKRREASPRRKLGERFACSEDLLPLVRQCLEEMPAWIPFNEESESTKVTVELHAGHLHFVPKNAKTDRSIVVEPALNSMFQLGIGSFIRQRLKREGVDLRYGQEFNSFLACLGSLTGALATLDLSSASDTVSYGLILDLLPYPWFDLLSKFRTGKVEFEGDVSDLQKFSSMGNGFTFPLETLIFFALAKSCAEELGVSGEVTAYGDDIIVPTAAYDLTVKVLKAVGFTPNAEKSFASGPFRESCGKDYLSGIDIRPFYLKGPLSAERAFSLHNNYVRRGMREPALIVLETIAAHLRLWGPDGYGDGHLIGGDLPPRRYGLGKGWCGYLFDTFVHLERRSDAISDGDMVLPFYSVYANSTDEEDKKYSDGTFVELLKGFDVGYLRRVRLPRGKSGRFQPDAPKPITRYDPDGILSVTTPGTNGYKRISIYTLTAW